MCLISPSSLLWSRNDSLEDSSTSLKSESNERHSSSEGVLKTTRPSESMKSECIERDSSSGRDHPNQPKVKTMREILPLEECSRQRDYQKVKAMGEIPLLDEYTRQRDGTIRTNQK